MEEMVEIYRKYMPQVYNFLFSLCHDAHLSEELTQETFFQALKSIDSFRGDCKIYVWLCSIAKHLWYKELKKKDRSSGRICRRNYLSENYRKFGNTENGSNRVV